MSADMDTRLADLAPRMATRRASEWTVTPVPRETAKKKPRTGQPEDITPRGTGTSTSRASPGPSWTLARRHP